MIKIRAIASHSPQATPSSGSGGAGHACDGAVSPAGALGDPGTRIAPTAFPM